MRIKVIKNKPENWYRVDEEYTVLDMNSYEGIGCQVIRPGLENGRVPDVVAEGDFEIIHN